MNEKGKERFWSKVDRRNLEGCWPWTAYRTGDGYGRFRGPGGAANSKKINAHRLAYMDTIGVDSLPPGTIICHHCDNPSCCNPDHLFAGTHADNAADKIKKGRDFRPVGESNGGSKLTDIKVSAARAAHKDGGMSYAELGRYYGVSRRTMRRAITRETWSHIG